MPHAFVSHSSRDAAVADAIRARLEAADVRCWIAPRDIAAGAVWSEAILRGIREAKALVLVASGASIASEHVLREVDAAASAGIPIVPVRIDDAPLAGALEYYLATTHWTRYDDPPDPAQLAALVDRLRDLLGVAAPPARVAAAPAAAATDAREERKTVSAVTVEIVVAGDGVEPVDPEDAAAAAEPLLGRLARRLAEAGAAVDDPAGLGLAAVFGAPIAHEDDPERAALSLLRVQAEVAEAAGRDPELGLALRAGIATGEALVRFGEGPARVAGDPPGAAARLAALAAPGELLVDDATARSLRRVAELEPTPGGAHRLLGWRASFGVDTDNAGRVQLVGRDRELAALVAALEHAERERDPQLVTLLGVPGIGKSRLVWELSEHVERLPELVWWRQGRSLPFGDGITFWALGEMVKAHAGILETDAGEAAAAKLESAVHALELGGEGAWVLRHLRPLVGLDAPADGAAEPTEAFAAWRRFFEALAERGPCVLVFEDLHWADPQLLDFIDHLIDWAVGMPLLVVATARPELLDRRPTWGGGKLAATRVRLAPLGEADGAALVDALLADVPLDQAARAAIRARAEGNPLYAEEYVQMLRDGDLLAGGTVRVEDLPLPEGVQGVIAARLDLLPAAEKQLEHDASVVGKVVWPGAVSAVGGYSAGEAEATLVQLVRRDFMRRERRSTVDGESEYAFRHPLVREVAYGQIPRAGRARRHAAVAAWLEGLPADRADDRAEMLAYHYAEALRYARAAKLDVESLRARAVAALTSAGERAAALHAQHAAARYLREALALAGPDAVERPALLLAAGRAAFHAERGGADELAEAVAALAATGAPRGSAEAETLLGRLAWESGSVDAARGRYRSALARVADEGVCRERVVVLAALSALHMAADENAEAIAAGRAALGMAESLGLEELAGRVLVDIGVTRALLGDRGGLDDLERAVGILGRISSPELARAHTNYAAAWLAMIDLAQASAHLEEAERAAQRFGDAAELRWLRGELALARYREGRWDEALALADSAIAASEAGTPHYLDGLCRGVRARIRLVRAGDAEGAAEDAAAALGAARAAGDPQVLVPALALCARMLLACDRPDAARPLAEELAAAAPRSLHSCDECGVDLAVALARFGLADGFLAAAAALDPPLLWVDAAAAVARGDLAAAVAAYERIGTAPDAAWARLRHADDLAAQGLAAEADAAAAPARAFLAAIGAPAAEGAPAGAPG